MEYKSLVSLGSCKVASCLTFEYWTLQNFPHSLHPLWKVKLKCFTILAVCAVATKKSWVSFSIIKTGKTVKKHDMTIYCNVIGSHCTVWWDKAHTLCSPDSLWWDKAHTLCSPDSLWWDKAHTLCSSDSLWWLTRLKHDLYTYTLWKQLWLTIPKGCEVTADAGTVTGHQKVSCIKDQQRDMYVPWIIYTRI